MCRLILVAFLSVSFDVGAQPFVAWQTNFSWAAYTAENAMFCDVDTAGDIYVAGETSTETNRDTLVLKYSADGRLLWQHQFPVNGLQNRLRAAVLDTNGNLYLAAQVAVNGWDSVINVLKLSPAGVPLWTNQIAAPGGNSYIPATIGLDSSQHVYVTGSGAFFATNSDYGSCVFVTRLTPSGEAVWLAILDRPSRFHDTVMHAAVDAASGSTYAIIRQLDYVTPKGEIAGQYAFAKISASGALEWLRHPGETNNGTFADQREPAGRALISQDAGIYFALQSEARPALWKFDSSGTLVWKSVFNGPAAPLPQSAVVDLFGNVTLCSSNLVIHFDRHGVQRWVSTISSGSTGLLATDETQTPFLRMAVTRQDLPVQRSMMLTRFEADGSRHWSQLTTASNMHNVGGLRVTNGACIAADAWTGLAGNSDVFITKSVADGVAGPQITSLSPARAAMPGEEVTLSISAVGAGALTYQWLHNGNPVFAATNNRIAVRYESGLYSVEVSDALGVTVSPSIAVGRVVPFSDQTAVLGGNVVLQARVADMRPRTMLWRHNGSTLANEASARLILTNVSSIDAGSYVAELDFGQSNTIVLAATVLVWDQVRMTWERLSAPAAPRTPSGVALTLDHIGNIAVLNGGYQDAFNNADLLLYTTDGQLMPRSIMAPGDMFAADGTGRLYCAGAHAFPYDNPIWIEQRAAPGQAINWTAHVTGGVKSHNTCRQLLVDSAGTTYLLSYYYFYPQDWPPNGKAGYLLSRIDPAGAVTNHFTFQDGASFAQITLAASNELAVAWAVGPSNFLARFSRDGSVRWISAFPPGEHLDGSIGSMAADGLGNVFTSARGRVTKWDSEGNLAWACFSSGSRVCAADSAGNLFLSRYAATIKYSPDGDVLWVHPAGGEHLKLDQRGNAYILGATEKSDNTSDAWIRKIDTNGIARWEAVYNSPFDWTEQEAVLEVERDGVVYLCGRPTNNSTIFLAKFVEQTSAGAPVVGAMPGAIRVAAGTTFQLDAPLLSGGGATYQWFRDGLLLEHATNQSLIITNFTPDLAGGYSVRVQNSFGVITSPETWAITPVQLIAPAYDSGTGARSFEFPANHRYNYAVERSTNLHAWITKTNYPGQVYGGKTVLISDNEPNVNPAYYRVQVTR